MTDEWVETISKKYIELYEKVIGSAFIPEKLSPENTEDKIVQSLKKIGAIP
jgi:phosphoribosylaminoimidazole-succinocarboxamide synthase